jgi:hypothetical protein
VLSTPVVFQMSLDVISSPPGVLPITPTHVRASLEHLETAPMLDLLAVKHLAYHLTLHIPPPVHDAQ